MEAQLKARKLGSATVRRQRIADRQKQRDLLHEQREERKKRLQRYSAAYSNPETDDSRSNSQDEDSLAETPSEISIRTPDNLSSSEVNMKGKVHVAIASMDVDGDALEERELAYDMAHRPWSKPSTGPGLLGASLNQPCDFRYDRFSAIMTNPDLQEPYRNEETASEPDHSSSEGEDSEEDDYSPIEIATPVTIFMPPSRPSVISVSTVGSPKKRVHRFSTKTAGATITVKTIDTTEKRLSVHTQPSMSGNNASGFFAGEAQPVETPFASSISVVSMDPNSASLPVRDDVSIKKKRSVPMLSKLTHGRMKSIKNFIAPLSPSIAPPMPQSPYSHQRRPSTGIASLFSSTSSHSSQPSSTSITNLAPSPPTRSMTEPFGSARSLSEQRPQTAKPLESTIAVAAGTADSPGQTRPEARNEPTLSRRKSFTNLRRRSGSIGQALKLSSGKTNPPPIDTHIPPLPPMQPQYNSVRFSSSMLTPQTLPDTPKSTQSARKSSVTSYSPFPSVSRQGQPVGLGLRM